MVNIAQCLIPWINVSSSFCYVSVTLAKYSSGFQRMLSNTVKSIKKVVGFEYRYINISKQSHLRRCQVNLVSDPYSSILGPGTVLHLKSITWKAVCMAVSGPFGHMLFYLALIGFSLNHTFGRGVRNPVWRIGSWHSHNQPQPCFK